MATYDLAYPGAAIDAILNTAYFLQEAGYIFQGSASEYSGTPSKRVWLIAPAGSTGFGLSSAVPQGSIGICLYNGTSWVGKIINVATIDSTPTQNSGNAVSSGGAYAAINQLSASVTEALENLTFTDTTPSAFQDEYINMKVSTTEGGVERILTYLTILAATTSKAGLLSAADKVKIDSFLTNLRSLTFTDTTASADQGTKITETLKATIGGVQEVIDSITLLAATSSKAGLLSASDKAYIDALPATLTNLSNSISGALALMQSMMGYYVCDTAAGTAAKTVAATGYSLTNGGCIRIKMNNANTAANVTLNINSTGAKALYYDGERASSTNTWEAGEVLEVYYDGTQYQCASGGGGKFATGESVDNVSLLSSIDSSGNLPKSSAVKSETDNLYANIGLFECQTAKNTAAKTVSAAGYKLTVGGRILVRMTNENTAANPTLNINTTGAKPLFYYGERASSANSWKVGSLLVVYYDGTNYNASLYVEDAKHIEYDGTLSGLPNTVQGAIDDLGNSIGKLYPPEVSAANLTCQSTNVNLLTVTNTSENNYEVHSITRTNSVYGKIFLPAMINGLKYRMSFRYTNTNTGSQDWSIRNSGGADIIRPAQMIYTIEQKDYSWDFIYTSNMSYLNFFCSNMVSGSTITINNLQFVCIDSYDLLKDKVAELDATVNGIFPTPIDTDNLSCSSTNTEKITVVCTSGNDYVVTNIERTAGPHGKLGLPTLVVGSKYRLQFNYTNTNTRTGEFKVKNHQGSTVATPPQMLNSLTPIRYEWDFVGASNYAYFDWDSWYMDTGSVVSITDFEIICIESYDYILDSVDKSEEFLNNAFPQSIITANLSCTSTDNTKFNVECISDNNYKVTCIEETAYVYGYIKCSGLVVGKKYRVSCIVTTDNEKAAAIAISNPTGGNSVTYRYIQKQKDGLLSFDFTWQQNTTPCLRFFCNDMQSGTSLVLNNLRIYEPDTLPSIYDEVIPSLSNTPYVYPSQRKIDIKSAKNYELTISDAQWSIPSGQTLAFYGDYIVRIPTGGKLTLLRLVNDAVVTVFTSPDDLEGHNNSAKFAPYKDANDEFPLLYVSAFTTVPICKVYRLTSSSVTLVQTITFNLPSTILPPVYQSWYNTHIGDDGCLYIYNFEMGVVKLTTPSTDESVVELDIDNVLDYFRFNYPYPEYVTQGGVIYKNMLFMPCGYNAGAYHELFVFDLAGHTLITKLNVRNWGGEPEDCDIKDGKLYVSILNGSIKIVDFL